ncbi:hypothetical protein BD410DRAFT_378148 [Rickenella mellea]|uniref:Uncharacterized protein n=1 Tax=Rickenella mellea TaxID=50990 RepID=A0A4Y7PZL0_9AGAM|nr:hypothetical protein BD410DRAFT_378148 [Rickenella mellea]
MLVLWTIVMWATTFGSIASVQFHRFLNGGWHYPALTSQATLSIRAFTDDFSFFRNTLLTLSTSVDQYSDEPPTDGNVPPDASATIQPSKTYNASISYFSDFSSFPSVRPNSTFPHSHPKGGVNSISGVLLFMEFIALLASGTICLRKNRDDEIHEAGELVTGISPMEHIFNNGIVPNVFDYKKPAQARAGSIQDGPNPERILSSIPNLSHRKRFQYEPANAQPDSTPGATVWSPSDDPVSLDTLKTNDDQNSTRTLADISPSTQLCNNNIGNVVEPNARLGNESNVDENVVSTIPCRSRTDEPDQKVATHTTQTVTQTPDAARELSVLTQLEVDKVLKSAGGTVAQEVHDPDVVLLPIITTGTVVLIADTEEESDIFVYPAASHDVLKTPTHRDNSVDSDQCAETPNVTVGPDVVPQAIHVEVPKSRRTDLVASLPPLPTTDEEVPTDIDDDPPKERKSASFRLPSEPKTSPAGQVRPLARAVTIHDIRTRETATIESDDEESTALNSQRVSAGLKEPVFPSLNDPDVIYVADGEPKHALDSQTNSRTLPSVLGDFTIGAEPVLSASSQNTVEVTSGGMDNGTWASMHAPVRRVHHNRITAMSLSLPCSTDGHQRNGGDSHERRITRKQQTQMKKGRRNDNKEPQPHSPVVPQGLEASMHAPRATGHEQGSSVDPPSRGGKATRMPRVLGLGASIHAPCPSSPDSEAPTTPPRSAELGLNASIHAPRHNTDLEPKVALGKDDSRNRGLNSSIHAPCPYSAERNGGKVLEVGFWESGLSASMHAPSSSNETNKHRGSPSRQGQRAGTGVRQQEAMKAPAPSKGSSLSNPTEDATSRECKKKGRASGRSEADGLGRRGKNIPKAKLSREPRRSSQSSRSAH